MTEPNAPFTREQLAQQYIPDFLEESDDHLRRSAQNLLALEKAIVHPEDKSSEILDLTNELLRSFHTLKGLSGIIGLTPAIELSHAIESILDVARREKSDISTGVIDSLVRGTQTLEKVIAILREEDRPLPDISAILAELSAHLPDEIDPAKDQTRPKASAEKETIPAATAQTVDISITELPEEVAAALDEKDWQRLQEAIDADKNVALAIFSPSEEKVRQGINVNNVREAVLKAAELIKAAPLLSNGEVRFAFLVCADGPLGSEISPDLSWTTLNLVLETAVSPPPVENPKQLRASTSVRVDIKRLDELMRLVGDLIVSRSRLMEVLPQLTGAPPTVIESLEQTTNGIERQLRSMREAVMRVRMVPLSEAFGRLPLAVRDLAKESGRKVRLEIQGEATEIDKVLVERLHDPLLHLARNAIAHGLETPEVRAAGGKPPEGVLTLSGKPEGDHILVSVSDDGGGINLKQIAAQARSKGLLSNAAAEKNLTNEEALDLLCQPGFTTKKRADLGAGRGVGMDVVRRMVDAVGGVMSMHTTKGQGTRFDLRLPLTMTIIDALIIRLGNERYAVPRGDVQEVIEIDTDQIVHAQHSELLPHREGVLPLIRLRSLFQFEHPTERERQYGLVGGENGNRYAIVVDRVTSMREIVVHTLSDELVARPGITGATDLGDGEAVLILDLPRLRRFARRMVTKKMEVIYE